MRGNQSRGCDLCFRRSACTAQAVYCVRTSSRLTPNFVGALLQLAVHRQSNTWVWIVLVEGLSSQSSVTSCRADFSPIAAGPALEKWTPTPEQVRESFRTVIVADCFQDGAAGIEEMPCSMSGLVYEYGSWLRRGMTEKRLGVRLSVLTVCRRCEPSARLRLVPFWQRQGSIVCR